MKNSIIIVGLVIIILFIFYVSKKEGLTFLDRIVVGKHFSYCIGHITCPSGNLVPLDLSDNYTGNTYSDYCDNKSKPICSGKFKNMTERELNEYSVGGYHFPFTSKGFTELYPNSMNNNPVPFDISGSLIEFHRNSDLVGSIPNIF
jgi:hypothetical protein